GYCTRIRGRTYPLGRFAAIPLTALPGEKGLEFAFALAPAAESESSWTCRDDDRSKGRIEEGKAMRMITLEEYIQAPPERVFEVFSDIPGTGARLSGISRIEMLSEGPIGKGTRWRETRTMFGKEAVEEMGITEFDPPRGYSVAAENHGAKYLTFYTLIPE